MTYVFKRLTSPRLNLFSAQKPERIHTNHLINRLNQHDRLNIIIILITLVMTGSLGLIFISSTPSSSLDSNQTVLGLSHTQNNQEPPSNRSTLTPQEYCRQNGGRVVSTNTNSGQDHNTCQFLDGSGCDLLMFFKTGTCFYTSPTPASSAKVYSPPPLTSPNPTPSLSIYYLTLIKKPDAPTLEVKLVDYLTSALNLPGSSVISGIYYDTRQGDPFDPSTGGKFNSSYYLITSVSLPPGTVDNYAASIDIKPIDIGLLPFLNNPLYCDTSLDCTIRDNFCATGAFNFFHPFSDGWLCRRQTDPQGGSLIIYDQDKQCRAQKEFAVPQCLDHRCTAAQVITQCIN